LEPEWKIYGSIIKKGSNQLDSFLIYQTSTPQLEYSYEVCEKFYNGGGFYCQFLFRDTNGHRQTVKVTFLSNGKIIETEKEVNFPNNTFLILKSGGFIDTILKDVNDECDISLYLLDYASNFNTTIHINMPCVHVIARIMKNNTILLVRDIKENYWSTITVEVPNLIAGIYLL
jgi:hypothetical protein